MSERLDEADWWKYIRLRRKHRHDPWARYWIWHWVAEGVAIHLASSISAGSGEGRRRASGDVQCSGSRCNGFPACSLSINLWTDFWIVCVFPMFLASNWFYTYQFNDFNSAKFNIRTRSLNNILYWTSQIAGAYIFGYGLDIKNIRRSMRAKVVWGVLFVIIMTIWGDGYAWQKEYTRAETASKTAPKMDWTSSGYVGPIFLYMFYGFSDGKSSFPGTLSTNPSY